MLGPRLTDMLEMLSVAGLWVGIYARVAVVLLLALGMGYLALHRVLRGPLLWPLAVITGCGLLSLYVGILSWLHWLTPVALLVLGVGLVALAPLAWRTRPALYQPSLEVPPNRLAVGTSVLTLGAFLLVTSVLTLYPPTANDALTYHLPMARDLVQAHGFQYDPSIYTFFFPQGNEGVFAAGMMLFPDPAVASGVEYAMVVATVALVLVWFLASGRGLAGGLAASLLVLASPILITPGTSPFIDAWTMAFLTAGLLVGLLVLDGGLPAGWASLVLAGFLLGQAAAAKYTGLAFAAAILVGLLVAGGRSRLVWPHLVAAALGALVAAAPWYAWTIHVAGSPIYPYGSAIFGNRSGIWSDWEIAIANLSSRDTLAPGLSGLLRQDLVFLLGRAPNLTVPGVPPLNPLIGLGLVAVVVPRWSKARPLAAALVASLLSVAAWGTTTSDPRFLLPALGVLGVQGGLVVEALWPRVCELLSQRLSWAGERWAALAAVPLTAIVVLSASSVEVARSLHRQGSPPTTAAARQTYLVDNVSCYGGVAYLNRRLGSNYTAYNVWCENARFYASGHYLGNAAGSAGFFRVLGGLSTRTNPAALSVSRIEVLGQFPNREVSTADVALRLRTLGASYVVVPASLLSDPDRVTAGGHFRLVYRGDRTYVFQVLT